MSTRKKTILPGAFAVSAKDVVFRKDGQVSHIKPDANVRRVAYSAGKPMKHLTSHDAKVAFKRASRALDDDMEAIDLGASEIACAVADAWEKWRQVGGWEHVPGDLHMELERLEAITRPSAVRKVRP
jgi:hypothetical protein